MVKKQILLIMKMIKKKFLFILFFIFLIISTLSFAYNGILVIKEPSAIFFAIGKYYVNHNDFDNAIKYFKKSIAFEPNFAEAYHNIGISYYYNGDTKKAIEFLTESIEIKKDYAKAHYSIALIYYEIKDFDNAILHLSKVTKLEPNNANANFDLAVAYVDRFRGKESSGSVALSDLVDLREAVKHYSKAEELKPGFPYALSNAEIVEDVIIGYEQNWFIRSELKLSP
jgi:tetratricopeptide (TPR) repeat protein